MDPNNSVIKRLWCTCFFPHFPLFFFSKSHMMYQHTDNNCCDHVTNVIVSQATNWCSRPQWLRCASDWRPGGRGFDPRRSRQHSFVEIDHEIFSTVILSLPLIQEGQLSVSGERMCTILVDRLEDKACPVNVWLVKLTALDMTPLGWLGRKTSTQTNKLVSVSYTYQRKRMPRDHLPNGPIAGRICWLLGTCLPSVYILLMKVD